MRKLLLITTLACAAGAAHAADPLGLYAGAGITNSQVDNFLGSGLDIKDTSYKILAGLHPSLSPVGAEVEYLDFGSETRIGAHAEAKAFAAYATGWLPLPVPILSVYGKAGLSRWNLSGSVVAPGFFGLSDHGTQFTWGVGALARFGNLAGRLEYERFNISGTDGANVVTLGAQIYLL